jgi:hypothetical protein
MEASIYQSIAILLPVAESDRIPLATSKKALKLVDRLLDSAITQLETDTNQVRNCKGEQL